MFEHLIARYADSARPFLSDLLASNPPVLSGPEAEAACRILLDLRDFGTWKESALHILPRYRRVAENLLAQDIQGNDQEKAYAAQRWLNDLKATDPASSTQPGSLASAARAPPMPQAPRALDSASVPKAPQSAARPGFGETLAAMNPATADDASASVAGAPSLLDFVNRGNGPVDIYWIGFHGERVLYLSGLKAGSTWRERTFTNHVWLVVASGTGGTTTRDTGVRLAGFQAVTPNDKLDPAIHDTAIITNADGGSSTGSGVSKPTVISRVEPRYSALASKLSIEGTVSLSIVVDPAGMARDFRVVKSLGYGLDEEAIAAVGKWRFKPGFKDGKEVSVRATIVINFRLGGGRLPDYWYYSGPIVFSPEAGVTPPVVKDVSMPRRVGDGTNASVVLGFDVDTNGSVKNIHPIAGPDSGSQLLSRSLAAWKFTPALKRGTPAGATGTIRFVKGEEDGAGTAPAPPQISESNPPLLTRGGSSGATIGATIRFTFKAVNGSVSLNGAPAANVDLIADLFANTANLLTGGGYSGSDRYLNLQAFFSSSALGLANEEATTPLEVDIGAPAGGARFANSTAFLVSAGVVNGIFSMPAIGTWNRVSSIGPLLGSATASGPLRVTLKNGSVLAITNFENAQPFGHASFRAAIVESTSLSGTNSRPDRSDTGAGDSIDGVLRRMGEKDLLLQTATGKVLRFRLLPITEFRDARGRPLRDSLMHPGDRITVGVNPDDVETVVSVVLIRPGSTLEREAASAAVEELRIVVPEPDDFQSASSIAAALVAPIPGGATVGGELGSSADPEGGGVIGTVYRVGGGVSAPRLIHRVDPEYAEKARRAKLSGAVVLLLVVDTEGRARNIHVARSLGMGLDEKAIEAVKKWRFTPAMKDGLPVQVRVEVEVNFRLI
jgi:TonB family protein